ncbi:amino acid adenylation domain-containing protein [Rhodopseudomonas sp. WA056]|uniref:non-ribosomal peptide synthetase n=1 Tax=Rhodopseudomonas TaxID=1073 RepID=UPI00115E2D4A|nr:MULTISPECIES: non-ribosomal peptide synthetase [Rhodopseudomonas]NEW86076.1 amino acid adenylation domain-containing protein [Rhodopseudomonas sp. WA056]QDL98008.1 non-ribosomal peptide synthetase [Rhodopseudomonas palustris]
MARTVVIKEGSGSGAAPHGTVPEILQRIARRFPEAVAANSERGQITFAELDFRSNQLARLLVKRGVEVGAIVVLLTGRSIDTLIGMTAILKAGGVYMPLDLGQGLEAINSAILDARPALILTEQQALPIDGIEQRRLGDELNAARQESVEPLSLGLMPSLPAYVMFTSGSTGRPKGVVVPHRAIVRLVVDADFMTLSPATVMLHAAPLAFDASTLEIWGPLLNGGQVVIVEDAVLSVDRIAETLKRFSVNAAWFTAGLFHVMVDERPDALSGLTTLLAGGDVLSPAHVRRAMALLPDCAIVNGYGPTENTTFTCCYSVPRAGWGDGPVPIGFPISGTDVRILSDTLEPVPDGEDGQLCAGGSGLALGYLNRPELTAEKFVVDPWSDDPAARLYLTGDYVRRRSDGAIEFRGRRDRQVKVNGVRIELDGVEQALRQDPVLADAAVVLSSDRGDVKRIVAFLKPRSGDAGGDLEAGVIRRLKDQLPVQAIPSTIRIVDELPLNKNGKIDRTKLLKDLIEAEQLHGDAGYEEFSDVGVGSIVGEIWAALLGRAVDARSNLFDLGATSLQMIAAHERIQAATGLRFPVTDLFAHPSIAEFQACLDGASHRSLAIAGAARGRRQRRAMNAAYGAIDVRSHHA